MSFLSSSNIHNKAYLLYTEFGFCTISECYWKAVIFCRIFCISHTIYDVTDGHAGIPAAHPLLCGMFPLDCMLGATVDTRHTVPAAVQKFRLLHTAPLYFDMGSKRPFILSAINLAIRRLFPVAEK